MRRIVVAVILGVLAGLTATSALAASPQAKKPREWSCLIARSASSKSVFCRAVLAGLTAQAGVGVNSNRLPYDEFGLAANQSSQPRIGGTAIPTTGPAVTGLGPQASVTATGNRLPYDEFGLAANQPSQPQIGSVDPEN
jgi:hypothetical protein